MDVSPSAAEGGKTIQQTNRDDAIWNALNTFYAITDKTQFNMEDLVEGFASLNDVNEGDVPKRDSIVQAITGFLSTGKRHPQNGGLRSQERPGDSITNEHFHLCQKGP